MKHCLFSSVCISCFLIATCVSTNNGIDSPLDSLSLSENLKKLATDALQKDKIQELFDKDGQFSTERILDRPDKGRQFVSEASECHCEISFHHLAVFFINLLIHIY